MTGLRREDVVLKMSAVDDVKARVEISAIVFEGGTHDGDISRWMDSVREEMAIGLCERLSSVGVFHRVVLCTDRDGLAGRALQRIAELDVYKFHGTGDVEFHFGERLCEVVKAYGFKSFLYFSGGSGQLMDEEDIRSFASTTLTVPYKSPCSSVRYIVANNAYSADMFGISDSSCLMGLNGNLPSSDNEFAMWFCTTFDADIVPLPSQMAFQFDVDTPVDALIMSTMEKSSIDTEGMLGFVKNEGLLFALNRMFTKIETAKAVMKGPGGEFTLIGRVPPSSVSYLNSILKCRIRIFSEERGMRSFKRDVRGEVKSIFTSYIKRCGIRNFVNDMSDMTGLAFVDTRVLLSSLGCRLSTEERFASDLFMTDCLKDEMIYELADAFSTSSCNFVCGGHCLVSWGVRSIALCR